MLDLCHILASPIDRAASRGLWRIAVVLTIAFCGCGTTRMSDTARTGTEQLLLSSAIDQAITRIDFEALAGKTVYLDTQYLKGVIDEGYVTSTLRQHLVANGCVLKTDVKEAKYVVEARAMVGTNRNEVLLGIPSMALPNLGVPGVPSTIPEIAFAKSTAQKGIAKIAVFAYNRESGYAVWQSGTTPITSNAQNTWLLGAGPFQRGSIYKGTGFAGNKIHLPFRTERVDELPPPSSLTVTSSAVFVEPNNASNIASPTVPSTTIPAGGSVITPTAAANSSSSVPMPAPPKAATPGAPAAAPPANPAAPPPPAPSVTSASGSVINTSVPAVNLPDNSWTGTNPNEPPHSGPWSGLMLVPGMRPDSTWIPGKK